MAGPKLVPERRPTLAVNGKPVSPQIKAVDYGQLMSMDVPKREAMLAPILPTQSTAMVYAPRGLGKTWFAMELAIAVATGGRFLKWAAARAFRTLYIDGELPLSVIQERLGDVTRRQGIAPAPGFLQIITPDLQTRAAPDLGDYGDQEEIDLAAEEAELIIVDNLSACLRSGAAENDAESWVGVSDWALRHRAAGRSVIFIHHAGKSGGQRGTSRREDLLDLVIALRRPQDYEPSQGARFEVHFEKARHLFGSEVEPFEARLDPDAPTGWAFESVEANMDEQIRDLLGLKLSQTEIARELGVNKSSVSRRIARMRELGVLPPEGAPVRNAERNTRQTPLGV